MAHTAIMVFNSGHIWTYKMDNEQRWWNLDSLHSGPSRIDQQQILKNITQAKHGSILFVKKNHVKEVFLRLVQR